MTCWFFKLWFTHAIHRCSHRCVCVVRLLVARRSFLSYFLLIVFYIHIASLHRFDGHRLCIAFVSFECSATDFRFTFHSLPDYWNGRTSKTQLKSRKVFVCENVNVIVFTTTWNIQTNCVWTCQRTSLVWNKPMVNGFQCKCTNTTIWRRKLLWTHSRSDSLDAFCVSPCLIVICPLIYLLQLNFEFARWSGHLTICTFAIAPICIELVLVLNFNLKKMNFDLRLVFFVVAKTPIALQRFFELECSLQWEREFALTVCNCFEHCEHALRLCVQHKLRAGKLLSESAKEIFMPFLSFSRLRFQ